MVENLTSENRPELSDLDLVRRAQMEDLHAYEKLVRRYHGGIYGFAYGMSGSSEDAAAVTQDVFVKAWKALGYFREPSGFHAWLYRIAINCAGTFRRKRSRHNAVCLEEFDPAIKQSESYKQFSRKGFVLRKISLGEFQKRMNAALNALSDKQRAVIILHNVQELSLVEVSKVLNGSEGAVRSRLLHAQKKIQNQFEVSREDLVRLLALKAYEHPGTDRAEKQMENTMRAVRIAHKKPSLHRFPDKNMGWMFAQPRYGVAALFIIFLGLHLLDSPLPDTPIGPGILEEPSPGMDLIQGADTNVPSVLKIPVVDPLHPSLSAPASLIDSGQ